MISLLDFLLLVVLSQCSFYLRSLRDRRKKLRTHLQNLLQLTLLHCTTLLDLFSNPIYQVPYFFNLICPLPHSAYLVFHDTHFH